MMMLNPRPATKLVVTIPEDLPLDDYEEVSTKQRPELPSYLVTNVRPEQTVRIFSGVYASRLTSIQNKNQVLMDRMQTEPTILHNITSNHSSLQASLHQGLN